MKKIDEAEKNRILQLQIEDGRIFNLEGLKTEAGPVFIVENPETAIHLATLGYEAIALGEAANAEDLRDAIARTRPRAGIIISLPWKDGYTDAADRIRGKLEILGIPYFVTDPEREAISVYNGVEATEAAVEESLAGLNGAFISKNNVAQNIAAFIEEVQTAKRYPAIKTGFKTFDELLGGGLYPGLYTLGAEPAAGKTAFAMQIADNISANGKDVFVYALEMSRNELIARSVSRITLEKATTEEFTEKAKTAKIKPEWLPKTAREIMDGNRYERYTRTEQEIIEEALYSYTERAKKLYIVESLANITAADIKQDVERWQQTTGSAPVVILDYLQILAPMNERGTDKQNADAAVKILKGISREYRTPVIVISSFNRSSYDDETGFAAFKESGSIEYTSDVLIKLELPEVLAAGRDQTNKDKAAKAKAAARKEALAKEPRNVELRILKNRFARPETTAEYQFYPRYSYFRPV